MTTQPPRRTWFRLLVIIGFAIWTYLVAISAYYAGHSKGLADGPEQRSQNPAWEQDRQGWAGLRWW